MLQSHIVQYFTKRYLKKFCAAALPFIPGVPLTALCGDFLGFRNNFLFEYPTQRMNNCKLNATHEYPTFLISNTTHENKSTSITLWAGMGGIYTRPILHTTPFFCVVWAKFQVQTLWKRLCALEILFLGVAIHIFEWIFIPTVHLGSPSSSPLILFCLSKGSQVSRQLMSTSP